MNNAHILGTERIGKLLVQYSIPAIIGMTITSLYNIIDSIFIGHGVGPMGIAGLAITFPLMNLVVAFCTMVSAGGSTISSIRLGQKDLDGATEVLGNTLTGYPRHLYHDWPKQYHACHGISQESDAHVYGNGSLQHNPRSHFHLPI